MNLFHLIFPCANIFLGTPPPPLNRFSNGPSLMSLRQKLNGFETLQNWLPGLTLHRLKIARHHRILHGRGSVVSAVSSRRMYFFLFWKLSYFKCTNKKNVNNVRFNSQFNSMQPITESSTCEDGKKTCTQFFVKTSFDLIMQCRRLEAMKIFSEATN